MKRSFLLALTFLASLTLGWLVARSVAPGQPPVVSRAAEGPRPPPAPFPHHATAARLRADDPDAQPSLDQRRESLLARLSASQPADIAPLLKLLEEHDDELIDVFMRQWVDRDPAAFARALEDVAMPPDRPPRWMAVFYDRWAQRDPEAAFAHATAAPLGRRSDATRAVLRQRFETDPDQALAWCAQVPPGDIYDAMGTWINRRPEQMADRMEALQKLPPSWFRENLLMAAVAKIAPTDPARALLLADSISPSLQSSAKGYVAEAWVKTNPEHARALVETTTDIALRWSMAVQLGQTWADSQPAEAIPWALRWLTGDLRQGVLRKAFAALEKTDPVQAAALRETLPRPVPPPAKP